MSTRAKQVLLLLAIFLVGVATGSINSIGLSQRRAEQRLRIDNLRGSLMEILTRELSLTPDQVQRIEPLVTSACEDYRTVTLETVHRVSRLVEAANGRIARELTPEQAARLRELQQERQKLVHERLENDYLKKDFLAE